MKTGRTILVLVFISSVSISTAQQQEKRFVVYTDYLLYIPASVPGNGLYPLMLFLHGSGERGSDLKMLKRNGPPSFLDGKSDFPFVVVSPLCPENRGWDTQSLLALLDHIEATLPIDKNRIYVTGLSLGGFATWGLAQAAPGKFAAIAPVCGGGDFDHICMIRDTPVWAFHGAEDTAVPYQESERLVQRLKELGSDVQFTLYPDVGHDSWTSTYQNPALYDWLLSKSRNISATVDSKILETYAGKYRYSNEEIMEVTYEGNNLYVKSSVSNNKMLMAPLANTKFRLRHEEYAGKTIPAHVNIITGDGDMYFNVTKEGKVAGFTVGPCDHTYCPRIE